ncbi:hypothetical protein MMC11_000940 [Xylographa trunciseda]|nr:hypothetical protein [Xylographa trunciseda]
MSQTPKFKDGFYTAKGWICRCGLLARDLTSEKEASKGEKFWKCGRLLNDQEKQCGFFIWFKNEEAARDQGASISSKAPETPTRRNRDDEEPQFKRPKLEAQGPRSTRMSMNPGVLPTPDSEDRPRSSYNRGAQRDLSPTPQRSNAVELNSSDEKTDLSTTVLKLLRDQQIELKSSTIMHINNKIDFAEKVYETKLQEFAETVFELRKKLDELGKDRE